MNSVSQRPARSWEEYKRTMTSEVDTPDFRGFTPLMLAAYRGRLEEVQRLLARGANPNLPDFMGNTPLMGVAFKGNVEVAKILMDFGADPQAKNKAGLDAMDIASSFYRFRFVKLLCISGLEKRPVARIRSVSKLLFLGIWMMMKRATTLLKPY